MKKIFLVFNKGDQKRLIEKAIRSAGSERGLSKLTQISTASLYDYRNEIRAIPIERVKILAKFLKRNFKVICQQTRKKYIEKWSKKEDKILAKNYKKLTAREMAKKMDKTVDSIKHRRRKLGLKKGAAYRWDQEKIISNFNKLKKRHNKTPTYKECSKESSGMIDAIERIWGKYSTFICERGLVVNTKKWNKEKCLEEFERLRKQIKKIPTQYDLRVCSGLQNAIIRRWKTYNNFLKKQGLSPNFELKWNKEKCINEFKKLMINRNHLITIHEMVKLNPALVAAIYKYFENYPSFLRKLNYEVNDEWQRWEKLVTKICKNLYEDVLIKPKLKNNKIPDITIGENTPFNKIVDAKLNAFANSINKDIKNYKDYCKKLEFWCLLGNKNLNIKNVEIKSFDKIKRLLKKKNKLSLIKDLEKMIKK